MKRKQSGILRNAAAMALVLCMLFTMVPVQGLAAGAEAVPNTVESTEPGTNTEEGLVESSPAPTEEPEGAEKQTPAPTEGPENAEKATPAPTEEPEEVRPAPTEEPSEAEEPSPAPTEEASPSPEPTAEPTAAPTDAPAEPTAALSDFLKQMDALPTAEEIYESTPADSDPAFADWYKELQETLTKIEAAQAAYNALPETDKALVEEAYTVKLNSLTELAESLSLLQPMSTADVAVVTVGGDTFYFQSFEEAWVAATASTGDATLKLLDNVEAAEALVNSTANLTLDLNGKTMTCGENQTCITISGSSALTVTSSTAGGLLTGAPTANFITMTDSANMTVTGGTVKNTGNGNTIRCDSTGAVSVSGGEVSGTGNGDKGVIRMGNAYSKATISGGKVSSKTSYAIYLSGSNSQIMVKGDALITSSIKTTIHLQDGDKEMLTLEVSGGRIENTGTGTAIYNNDDGKVSITGGEVESEGGTAVLIANCGSTMSITNGTIKGETYAVKYENEGKLDISGGTITGGEYGVYLDKPNGELFTLSGTPTISGTKAGISVVKAFAAGSYTGSPCTVNWLSTPADEATVVTGSTNTANFTLTNPGWGLAADTTNNQLVLQKIAAEVKLADSTTATIYSSFAEAWKAATASTGAVTLTLLDNVETAEALVNSTANLTLELNGKELKYTETAATFITLKDSAGLTVQSTVEGGKLAGATSKSLILTTSSSNAFLTIAGGTVQNSSSGATVYHNSKAALTVTGGILTNKGNNVAIDINASALVAISGGTVSATGTAVYHGGRSKLTVSGTALVTSSNNTTIYLLLGSAGSDIFELTGGKVENTDQFPAIENGDQGTVRISGGEVVGNGASAYKDQDRYSAALYISGGTLTSTNANALTLEGKGLHTISGGTITGKDYGIYKTEAGTLTLSGSPAIKGQKAALYTKTSFTATGYAGDPCTVEWAATTLTEGDPVVTAYTDATKFTLTNTGWELAASGENLVIQQAIPPVASVQLGKGEVKNYKAFADAWKAATVDNKGGVAATIKLLDDVESEAELTLGGKSVTLDLNGKTLTNKSGYSAVSLSTGDTFTLIGTGGGTFNGDTERGIYNGGGTLNLNGGTLTSSGEAALYNTSGTATVNAGAVVKNVADEQSAIINDTNATLSITGGTVESGSGVAVTNISKNVFSVSGGEIISASGNAICSEDFAGDSVGETKISGTAKLTAKGSKDCIDLKTSAGAVTVSGGEVMSNGGNAISNLPGGTVTITGGKLTAAVGSYGIYNGNTGTVTVSGGTISTGNGGYGICNYANGTVSISGTPTFTGGKANIFTKLAITGTGYTGSGCTIDWQKAPITVGDIVVNGNKNAAKFSVTDKKYVLKASGENLALAELAYTITYTLNDGTVAAPANPTSYTEETESFTLKNPTKAGYTFKGWGGTGLTGTANTTVTITKGSTGDRSYTANWTANTNTGYKVEHYKQNLDGTYPTVPRATEELTGTTNATVMPQTHAYGGFTVPARQAVTIKADGSTVVQYKYTRNSYMLSWDLDGGTAVGGTPAGSVKYEASLIAPTLTKTGYTFAGWTPTVPATMPDKDRTYTALWEDTEAPKVTIGSISTNWEKTAQEITLSYFDSGSGIKSAEYAFTASVDTKPQSLLAMPESGKTVQASENGTQYLYYCVTDNDGNVAEGCSDAIRIDAAAPEAEIQIEENSFTKFLNTVSFGLFFKESVDVKVTGTDPHSGVEEISYQKVAAQSEFNMDGAWLDYAAFSIAPNEKFIVYARVKDKVGNQTVVNSQGTVVYTDSALKTGEAVFNPDIPADVSVELLLNGNTLKELKNGEVLLEENTDYTVQNSIVTLKKEYLKTALTGSQISLQFAFNPMGEEFTGTENAPVAGSFKVTKHVHTPAADDGDCTTAIVCTVCGYETTAAKEHVLSPWQSDADKHWKKCTNTGCSHIESSAKHSLGQWIIDTQATEVEKGSKHRDCGTCAYTETAEIPVLPHSHKPEEKWSSDAVSHWNNCIANDGEKMNLAAHIAGAPPTAEHGQSCTVCGYELAPKLSSVIVDKETGTEIEREDDTVFDADIRLVVTPKSAEEMEKHQDSVDKVAKGLSLSGLYDIKLLKDGMAIQPDGKMKISLTLTDAMKAMTDLQVVYIDDNGVTSIIPSTNSGGKLVFITDHFSYYGVIGKNTTQPTISPSAEPTVVPSAAPTTNPTTAPSSSPTAEPTTNPTIAPSSSPTAEPTTNPTTAPSTSPSAEPTTNPSAEPTTNPTTAPSTSPSAEPTTNPTTAPSTSPSTAPTTNPTTAPTASPTAKPNNPQTGDSDNALIYIVFALSIGGLAVLLLKKLRAK